MFLAIDADILLYRSALSAETEIDWGDDVFSLWADVKDAKIVFKQQIEAITSKLKVDDIVCCLSDSKANFRKLVDPSYKSNRKGTRKPVGYKALRQWVISEYKTVRKDGLEGDDCLGILGTKPGSDCIMVSDDKDLRTCPGKLYRPSADEFLNITEDDANRFFLTQVLTGDPTDGYKGCPKIGIKTAEKVLGHRPSWDAVEQAFVKAGLSKDDAIQQARLARILRWSDWDEQKGEPILWKP